MFARLAIVSRRLVLIALCLVVGASPVMRAAQAPSKDGAKDGAKNGDRAATKEKNPKKSKVAAPPPQIAWPLPPEEPRIRYVTSYRGAGDFKPAKKPSRFMTIVLGGDDSAGRQTDTIVKPYGLAVSDNGVLYVTDTATRRVFAFDTDKQTVSFIGENGSQTLAKPIGVAVGPEGRLFVADATLKRVFVYSALGEFTTAIGHDGELTSPSGLAVDRVNRRVYVADAARHQILSYSIDDGSLLTTIGKRGAEPGEFNFPTNLCVDAVGRLYVADTLNFRIQIFNSDGTFLKTFGTLGDTPGTLNRPKGISVDSDGHIYIVDSSFNNFQIFDGEGQLLLFVGTGGSRLGQFMLPAGLSIDAKDRIYIADQSNGRVQVFQYLKEGARP